MYNRELTTRPPPYGNLSRVYITIIPVTTYYHVYRYNTIVILEDSGNFSLAVTSFRFVKYEKYIIYCYIVDINIRVLIFLRRDVNFK